MQANSPGVSSNAVTLLKKKRKIRHCLFTFSKNITLHFKVMHGVSKKCTKKDNTSAKMFFAYTTIIFDLLTAVVFMAIH